MRTFVKRGKERNKMSYLGFISGKKVDATSFTDVGKISKGMRCVRSINRLFIFEFSHLNLCSPVIFSTLKCA
jgi:hypothetical protein